jgi:hypothetical protein
MDFLIQALDAFEAAKASGDSSCPRHEVRLRVIAGASAGGITAALLAGLAHQQFQHADNPVDGCPDGNTLFDTWVNRIDIGPLLGRRDLQARSEVQSLLDSSVIAEIAAAAFRPRPEGRPARRSYLADPLDVLLTVTNLPGVPYPVNFGGCPANTVMMLHADRMHFAVGTSDVDSPGIISLKPGQFDSPGWCSLRDAAVATGAFPLGLAPKVLFRENREVYANRFLGVTPLWSETKMRGSYRFLCVDGGVVDNEPMGVARAILQRHAASGDTGGSGRNYALILVDAFPRAPASDDGPPEQSDFLGLLFQLVNSVLNQSRFKYDELHPAEDPDIYSRFMVAPLRRLGSHTGPPQDFALACGPLWGFGGFLDRDFRMHDYQLGRRNCQRFLERHFALPAAGPSRNPLFDGWPQPAIAKYRIERRRGSYEAANPGNEVDVFLPIIPLVGNAAAALDALAPWPTLSTGRLEDLRKRLELRVDAIACRLIDRHVAGWASRRMANCAWWFKRRDVVNRLMDLIQSDLLKRGQLIP